MAVKKSRKRRNGNGGVGKIPVAVVAGFLPSAFWVWDAASQGNLPGAGSRLVAAYTGWVTWAHAFDWNHLKKGLFPVLAGVGVHLLANRLGFNRYIRKIKWLPVEI